jgi:hypothetical protein
VSTEIIITRAGGDGDPAPYVYEILDGRGRRSGWGGWFASEAEARAEAEKWLPRHTEATHAMVESVNRAMSAAHGRPEEELVNIEDPLENGLPDLQDVPDAAAGYEEWLDSLDSDADVNAVLQDVADLMEWARASLPAAEVACTCTDGSCLRCRVQALVDRESQSAPAELPAGSRCPKCGGALLWFEGESYCVDCTRFEPAA